MHGFLLSSRRRFLSGFTLVELLVSVVILGVATGVIVQASNLANSSGRRGSAGVDVNNLISRDLNWLRWYAKAWRCTSGCTHAKVNQLLSYSSGSCATVVTNFLADANNQSTKVAPVGPGVQELAKVSGVALNRNINSSTRSLTVQYSYQGTPPIDRFSSVLIQASGWCTEP